MDESKQGDIDQVPTPSSTEEKSILQSEGYLRKYPLTAQILAELRARKPFILAVRNAVCRALLDRYGIARFVGEEDWDQFLNEVLEWMAEEEEEKGEKRPAHFQEELEDRKVLKNLAVCGLRNIQQESKKSFDVSFENLPHLLRDWNCDWFGD
jgi:hypothetical protein